MKLMNYKGYFGSIDVSTEDKCLFGKLEFINPLVSYQAGTVRELEEEFRASVDDYLGTCAQEGWEPEKPYKGSFNIRIGKDLHKKAVIEAKIRNIKLNELVKNAIEHELEQL